MLFFNKSMAEMERQKSLLNHLKKVHSLSCLKKYSQEHENPNTTFRDSGLQEQFDRDGFVKIKLMEESDVALLNQLFRRYFPNPSKDFFHPATKMTLHSKSKSAML